SSSASFSARPCADSTGDAHAGASVCDSPPSHATASIRHTPSARLKCAPRDRRRVVRSNVVISLIALAPGGGVCDDGALLDRLSSGAHALQRPDDRGGHRRRDSISDLLKLLRPRTLPRVIGGEALEDCGLPHLDIPPM